MNDRSHERMPTGRDVAGAWLFCALIVALALGLSAPLHGDAQPAATIRPSNSPYVPHLAPLCRGLGANQVKPDFTIRRSAREPKVLTLPL